MNTDEYRSAIAALGLSQVGAAKALGIHERTSRRYALKGVPEKHSAWLREKLTALGWSQSFRDMARKSEEESDDRS